MFHKSIAIVMLVSVFSSVRADEGEVKELLAMINRQRAKKELPELRHNDKLADAAQRHSANMARQDKMGHVLDGKSPADRVRDAGYQPLLVGENIAFGQRTPLTEVFDMWMKSPPHRENVLGKSYEEVGIGIAAGPDGKAYYTLVFGTPRP